MFRGVFLCEVLVVNVAIEVVEFEPALRRFKRICQEKLLPDVVRRASFKSRAERRRLKRRSAYRKQREQQLRQNLLDSRARS